MTEKVRTMKKAHPSDGAGLMSFQEGVAGGHIEPPGLKLGEAIEGYMREEVLGRDGDEVRGFDEDVLPDLVSVASKVAEAGRGDGPELPVGRGVDVDQADPIDVGDANIRDARDKELLAQELIKWFEHEVFDPGRNGKVDRREFIEEEGPVGLDAIGTVGAEAFIGCAVRLRVFPLDEEHDAAAVGSLVHDHGINARVARSSMAIGSELRDLTEIVGVPDPLESDERFILHGEHTRDIGEVREEEGCKGIGAIDEGVESVHAEYLGRAQVVRRETWESGAVPDDAEAVEGAQSIGTDFMEKVVAREFEGQAKREHTRAIKPRRFGEPGKNLGCELPGGLALLFCSKECHMVGYLIGRW